MADAALVGPGSYCRDCGYQLRGLAEFRCPECGRAFDPADPHSFLSGHPHDLLDVDSPLLRAVLHRLRLVAAAPFLMFIALFVVWMAGWYELGHRPRKYVDDPKDIGGFVAVLHPMVIPAFYVSLLANVLNVGLLATLCITMVNRRRKHERIPVRSVVITCAVAASLVGSVGLFFLDPMGIGAWWAD